MPTIPVQYTQWHNIMLLELTCVETPCVSNLFWANWTPPLPVLCPWSNGEKKTNEKCSQKQKVVLGILIGTKEKLRYKHEKDQMEMDLCCVWRGYKWMVQKKGWKSLVVQALGHVSIGSAIYGLDSFPLLVPSHIDYSKIDPGLSDRAYFLQKARNYVHKITFYHWFRVILMC